MRRIDASKIVDALKKAYPSARTELKHSNPFELLIATILSAQTTDRTVNKVCPELFKKYPDPYSLSKADIKDIEEIVKPTGFYKQKARYIVETSKILVEKFNGKVPDTMDKLLELKGVSRKTANVVLSNAFGKAEGIVVDTHVRRLVFRCGWTDSSNPEQIEEDLMGLFDKKDWNFLSNALVLHGRYVCTAKKPLCDRCVIEKWCEKRI